MGVGEESDSFDADADAETDADASERVDPRGFVRLRANTTLLVPLSTSCFDAGRELLPSGSSGMAVENAENMGPATAVAVLKPRASG